MKKKRDRLSCWFTLGLLGALAYSPRLAQAVNVNVIDDSGAGVANGFRWTLEEDNTYGPGSPPGIQNPNAPFDPTPGAVNPSYTLAVNIHKSHAPLVCTGDTSPDQGVTSGAFSRVTINASTCTGYDPAKRYIISVLPWHTSPAGTAPSAQTGYMMSGRDIAANAANITVISHNFPMPTAQVPS